MASTSCEQAVKVVKKYGAYAVTREELAKMLGHDPVKVTGCRCGEAWGEHSFAKVWYIVGLSMELEDRAASAPFAGFVTDPALDYTAIARCKHCNKSQPIFEGV